MRLLLLLFLLLNFASAKVFVVQWKEAVSPLMVDHIKRSLQKAEKEGGTLFLLELDTPGGLESSMREVVQEFQRTPFPVVVYVYPPGGRAASAGAIITISADIAVMAPGTNIGAATPVQVSGENVEKDVKQKVMQDMLAFVRSIAKEKGRNSKVVEKMITEAVSLTPEEALWNKVIDLIAENRAELLKSIEGRVVKKHGKELTIKTTGVQVVEVEKNLKEELLSLITNPTLAYMLLLIGFYGIFFELYNPGTIIPGAVGVICLLLGLYGLGVIGVNWLGLLLVLAGLLLLALELITPAFGGLALAGAIALALGSLILISPDSPYGDIPISTIAVMVGFTVAFFLFAGRLGIKAQKSKKMLGVEGLIGMQGEAYTNFEGGKGKVFLNGELWNAVSQEPIRKGESVLVEEVKGMVLKVRKV
ncbi:MAG: nodulation protein NfeD [Aquificaceae bacterium]|nr:nodulation protein NfeD [Aquificaceae bacterium]